jgi:Transcriptional regulator
MPRLRNQERHEAILDVAIQLVREQGVAAASLQDIADRAGIKKGSLANYFRSKAELAELIQDRFTKIADQVLQEIIQRDDINAQEKLRELLYLHAEHCAMRVSSPVFVSFMQLWAPASSPEGRRQLEIRDRYSEAFATQVRECIKAGVFGCVDVKTVVRGMVGMMTHTAFWYNADEHGPLRPHVDALISMCFRGLEKRP